jgi:hypothetical protein
MGTNYTAVMHTVWALTPKRVDSIHLIDNYILFSFRQQHYEKRRPSEQTCNCSKRFVPLQISKETSGGKGNINCSRFHVTDPSLPAYAKEADAISMNAEGIWE